MIPEKHTLARIAMYSATNHIPLSRDTHIRHPPPNIPNKLIILRNLPNIPSHLDGKFSTISHGSQYFLLCTWDIFLRRPISELVLMSRGRVDQCEDCSSTIYVCGMRGKCIVGAGVIPSPCWLHPACKAHYSEPLYSLSLSWTSIYNSFSPDLYGYFIKSRLVEGEYSCTRG